MRTAITLAWEHKSDKPVVLRGPDVPIAEHYAEAKRIAAGGKVHPRLSRVEVWESGNGISKTLKFNSPPQAVADKTKIKPSK